MKYLFIKKNVFCKRKEAEKSVSLIRSEFYDADRDLKLLTIIFLMGFKNHNLLSMSVKHKCENITNKYG